MVKIQFVCFEHIISIAIFTHTHTHKRSVVDDTVAATTTASTISTTKSTYYPNESKRKQHLHLKILPHPFYFNSFHFISFCFVSFFVPVFIAYFSTLVLTFPHSLLTLLHSYISNLRFNIMLCTFSLVLRIFLIFFIKKRVVHVCFHDNFFSRFWNHSLLSSNMKKTQFRAGYIHLAYIWSNKEFLNDTAMCMHISK